MVKADWKSFFSRTKKVYEEGSTRAGITYLFTLWKPCCHSMARQQAIFCSSINAQPNFVCHKKEKDGTLTTLTCPQSVLFYNEHMGGVD